MSDAVFYGMIGGALIVGGLLVMLNYWHSTLPPHEKAELKAMINDDRSNAP